MKSGSSKQTIKNTANGTPRKIEVLEEKKFEDDDKSDEKDDKFNIDNIIE